MRWSSILLPPKPIAYIFRQVIRRGAAPKTPHMLQYLNFLKKMRTNEIVDNPYQKINLLPLLHRYFRGPVRTFEQPFAMILVVEQADIRTR